MFAGHTTRLLATRLKIKSAPLLTVGKAQHSLSKLSFQKQLQI